MCLKVCAWCQYTIKPHILVRKRRGEDNKNPYFIEMQVQAAHQKEPFKRADGKQPPMSESRRNAKKHSSVTEPEAAVAHHQEDVKGQNATQAPEIVRQQAHRAEFS